MSRDAEVLAVLDMLDAARDADHLHEMLCQERDRCARLCADAVLDDRPEDVAFYAQKYREMHQQTFRTHGLVAVAK